MVFQAVPLGSHRRIAHPNGDPDPLPAGAAPGAITLLPMVTNTFYARVPELDQNWADFNNGTLQAAFVHTVRLMQWGLVQDAVAQNGFGLSSLHHAAPRRLRVAGKRIRDGATLILLQHADALATGGPNQFATREIVLPLYATDQKTAENLPIWETVLELEPIVYYSWMLGGPEAPGVEDALTDYLFTKFNLVDPNLDQPPVGSFDPLNWNLLYVQVKNTDGGTGDGGWQPLFVD